MKRSEPNLTAAFDAQSIVRDMTFELRKHVLLIQQNLKKTSMVLIDLIDVE